jgi:hypothetical protein
MHSLYITGESYAGVYVPTLVREILNDVNSTMNLAGFAGQLAFKHIVFLFSLQSILKILGLDFFEFDFYV